MSRIAALAPRDRLVGAIGVAGWCAARAAVAAIERNPDLFPRDQQVFIGRPDGTVIRGVVAGEGPTVVLAIAYGYPPRGVEHLVGQAIRPRSSGHCVRPAGPWPLHDRLSRHWVGVHGGRRRRGVGALRGARRRAGWALDGRVHRDPRACRAPRAGGAAARSGALRDVGWSHPLGKHTWEVRWAPSLRPDSRRRRPRNSTNHVMAHNSALAYRRPVYLGKVASVRRRAGRLLTRWSAAIAAIGASPLPHLDR